MNAVPDEYLSLEDYYHLEETSEVKHEYYQGAAYALTGASATHNLILANLLSALRVRLRGKQCRVVPSDLRLKIEATSLYTFPDAQVICGPFDFADGRNDTITNPTVLIEVLSPSTEDYDRGKKFLHYRTIASLQEVLLVAQDRIHVEQYSRQEADQWLLRYYTELAQTITLKSIDCLLPLADIYEEITFQTTEGQG